ncbi:MAG: D-alanyl-D-alanine carboxypeptidase, partial [Bacteroidales bacterium]|nr:D-alanyl-D-alanine carboxypeptidase [Bacteroidales bacterium]
MQNYLYSLFLCLLLHGVTFAQAQTNVATIDSVATDTLHGDTLAVDTFAVAIDVPFGEVLKQRLAKLLENPTFERTQVGLYVYDLTGDSVVFAHNQRQQLR